MRNHTRPPKKRHGQLLRLVILLVLLAIGYNYVRPLPHASASLAPIFQKESDEVQLAWPAQGSAAIGAAGFGVLATHGPQDVKPAASLAKLITVLAVLEKHPLKAGEPGPTLTMTQADADLFNSYFARGGAYVQVASGQKITLYQALQAILLPSANNMSDTLAIWAFDSMEKYHQYANGMLKRLKLDHTVVAGDASGFLPDSKSTPGDLVRLGEFAMQAPVIAEIVAQKSATIPGHGIVYSANSRLGYNNIIGIKTGLTDEAGGCFLFAARYTAEKSHKPVTIIGVITGAPTLNAALAGSEPLLNSAKPYFSVETPVKAGEVFGVLTTPWLATSQVIAKGDISLVTWRGAKLEPQVKLANINRSLPVGAQVGTAIVASGSSRGSAPLVLRKAITGPTWQWRVKRF
jgi:D-alanyl-D-alanine carboxypeptidase (penicillin-binding protein 5/6)